MTTSPCTGVCTMDEPTGWCLGCGRTRDEIGGWGSRSPEARSAIWAALPDRLDRLGVVLRRPDWDEDAVRSAVLDRIRIGAGLWNAGPLGRFAAVRLHDPGAQAEGGWVLARGQGSALRLRVDRHIRALRHPGPPGGGEVLVLAVSRLRLPDSRPDALCEVGPDDKALLPGESGGILFDLGLGLASARLAIRTGDAALVALLRAHAGQPLGSLPPEVLAALDAARPVRVVDAPGLRFETVWPGVEAESAAPLLPALAALTESPSWLGLDEAYAPVAVHFAGGFPPGA